LRWCFYGLWSFFSIVQQAGAAPAAVITVDSATDDPDASGGTGPCATSSGDCTLRAAIETAQTQAGADVINFSADFTINLTGSLPTLVETDLTIDGTGHTVQVNGGGIVDNVFQINGQGITIKNLRIYGSSSGYSNIWIRDNSLEVEIANNLIGDDDPAPGGCGQSDLSFGGIYISAPNAIGELITAWYTATPSSAIPPRRATASPLSAAKL
jgi:CSLREA domain-containing protein